MTSAQSVVTFAIQHRVGGEFVSPKFEYAGQSDEDGQENYWIRCKKHYTISRDVGIVDDPSRPPPSSRRSPLDIDVKCPPQKLKQDESSHHV